MVSLQSHQPSIHVRRFSKLTCFSTLLLIFIGGLVKSTESGLAVPDWPLSYGSFFPPMVGGVFYEHGHRMAASLVGLFMLILSVWLGMKEKRRWVKVLGFCALGAVIAQGILGGLTVLLFLPPPISIAHGTLAQTFFLLTIVIAYALSAERGKRVYGATGVHAGFLKNSVLFLAMVYIQLLLGALMRHTQSGLAVGDFPTMGGEIIPMFDAKMLANINAWRFGVNLDPVTFKQVVFHALHRSWALILTGVLVLINIQGFKTVHDKMVLRGLIWLDIAFVLQICLGVLTIFTLKEVILTTLHVANGALVLGLTMFLILRSAPLSWREFQHKVFG